jgi:hypothetical protein
MRMIWTDCHRQGTLLLWAYRRAQCIGCYGIDPQGKRVDLRECWSTEDSGAAVLRASRNEKAHSTGGRTGKKKARDASAWSRALGWLLLARAGAGSGLGVRNCAQVFVDCVQIVVGHALIHRPGHYLEHRTKLRMFFVEVYTCPYDQFELLAGETFWQARRKIWCDVAGSKWSKRDTSCEIVVGIKLFGLAQIRVVAQSVGWGTVAVVAAPWALTM